jgi:hypothetical protein
VAFQYTLISPYVNGVPTNLPAAAIAASGIAEQGRGFGVDWSLVGPDVAHMVPWVAVHAQADTDADGQMVFVRSSSVNRKVYRFPNDAEDNGYTY